MGFPTAASKANCDASSDDPKQALLTDLATLIDKFNTLLSECSAALLSKTDAATLYAALAGAAFSGGINEAKSVVASAATPTIFTASIGNVIDYTGTTACTGFAAAPQAGCRRLLVCAGAASFTAGANMLIDGYSSGSTLTVAAGDRVEVIAITTTQFRLSHRPAVSGKLCNRVIAKTAAYTVVIDDNGSLINATSGTWSLSLPAAATAGNGFAVAVRNSGGGVITIDPNASETVDGVATVAIGAGLSCFLVCNGANWCTVGRAVEETATTVLTSTGTIGSSYQSVAHGMGAIPKRFTFSLYVNTAVAGWSVGDEILFPITVAGGSEMHICWGVDATNFYVVSQNPNCCITNKSTGANTVVAVSNFKGRVRCSNI